MNDTTTEFQRDSDGNIIDPPVNPEFEQRLAVAASSGDNNNVVRVQTEYDTWRRDEVARIEGGDLPTVETTPNITAQSGGETGSGAAGAPVNIDLDAQARAQAQARDDAAPAPPGDVPPPASPSPGDTTVPGGGAS